MGKSSRKNCQVAGHWYAAGIHMIFCQRIDELLAIRADKKNLWFAGETHSVEDWVWDPITETWVKQIIQHVSNPITATQNIHINKRNIFGGTDRAGGVEGTVSVEFGSPTQLKNPYLVRVLGNDVTAHRGSFGLLLNHVILSANTPRIKPWEIRAKRTKFGWQDHTSEIDEDMNPAHLLLECLTDNTWGGLGYAITDLDEGSFLHAAGVLSAEGYGISMLWDKNISLDDFMKNILAHINGVLFQSYRTGLFTLKLIRHDYAGPGGMPALNEANIISLENYEIKATSETINSVTIKFTNRDGDISDSVTANDLANITAVGKVVHATKEFYGFTKPGIAGKVASRELLQLSLPLSQITVLVNRTQYALEPGDTFVFNWSKLGVSNQIMRVTSIDIGTLENSMIRIDATADIFGFDISVVAEPPLTRWEDPNQDAQFLTVRKIQELSYYQTIREVFGGDETVSLHPTDTYFHGIADAPSFTYIDYELWSQMGTSPFTRRAIGFFSKQYTLLSPVPLEVYSWIHLSQPLIITIDLGDYFGRYGYLGDELVQIVNINQTKDQIQVARGVHDTVPVAHLAGTFFQLCDQMYTAINPQIYTISDVVDFKFLPATANGRMTELQVTDIVAKIATGRLGRPLPPGNVRFNNVQYPPTTNFIAVINVTWSHRDRLTQTEDIFHQDFGHIGPEAGTVYNIRVYDEHNLLLFNILGLTLPEYSINLTPGIGNMRVELESVRDNLISHQTHDIEMEFAGYGLNYGKHYGGV